MRPAVPTEQLWQWTHAERRRLLGLLEQLPEQDWQAPSLCTGWEVRHVAAHVASSPATRPAAVAGALLRGRGSFNRALYLEGLRLGSRPPAAILDELRRYDGARTRPFVTTRWDPLVDILVHSQDIAVPLGLSHPMPTAPAAAAAAHVWAAPFPFRARRRLRGFRLSATDAQWSAGSGRAVHGPIAALLLLLTGRSALLSQLEGEGAQTLVRRQLRPPGSRPTGVHHERPGTNPYRADGPDPDHHVGP